MLCRAAKFLRDRHGATTVEIAFALPIFIALLLGTFEFGRLFFTWSTIQYATEQTGRFAMSKPAATASELSTYLKKKLPGIVASTVAVSVTPQADAGVNYMVIVARVHFSFMSIFPIAPVDIEGRSRVPMVV